MPDLAMHLYLINAICMCVNMGHVALAHFWDHGKHQMANIHPQTWSICNIMNHLVHSNNLHQSITCVWLLMMCLDIYCVYFCQWGIQLAQMNPCELKKLLYVRINVQSRQCQEKNFTLHDLRGHLCQSHSEKCPCLSSSHPSTQPQWQHDCPLLSSHSCPSKVYLPHIEGPSPNHYRSDMECI